MRAFGNRASQLHGRARRLAVFLGATLLLCSPTANASGGGGHALYVNWWEWDQHAPPVGWFILDFLLFGWILVRVAKQPLRDLFASRSQGIGDSLAAAAREHSEAETKHQHIDTKLSHFADERRTMLKQADKDGQQAGDRIIADAGVYSDKIRRDTERTCGNEERLAVRALSDEVIADALAKTHTLLRDNISPDDQTRLVEAAILALEGGDSGAANMVSAAAKGTST